MIKVGNQLFNMNTGAKTLPRGLAKLRRLEKPIYEAGESESTSPDMQSTEFFLLGFIAFFLF